MRFFTSLSSTTITMLVIVTKTLNNVSIRYIWMPTFTCTMKVVRYTNCGKMCYYIVSTLLGDVRGKDKGKGLRGL